MKLPVSEIRSCREAVDEIQPGLPTSLKRCAALNKDYMSMSASQLLSNTEYKRSPVKQEIDLISRFSLRTPTGQPRIGREISTFLAADWWSNPNPRKHLRPLTYLLRTRVDWIGIIKLDLAPLKHCLHVILKSIAAVSVMPSEFMIMAKLVQIKPVFIFSCLIAGILRYLYHPIMALQAPFNHLLPPNSLLIEQCLIQFAVLHLDLHRSVSAFSLKAPPVIVICPPVRSFEEFAYCNL